MPNFQLRLSYDWIDVSGTYAYIADMSEKVLVFQHLPEVNGNKRRHYHMYFFNTSRKEDTIRKFLKKQDLSGTDWSLSTKCGKDSRDIDVSGAYIYGTKKELIPDVFNLRKNISPVQVDQLKVLAKSFWDGGTIELHGKSIKKPREKSKKDDKYEIVEEIYNTFNNTHKCSTYCDSSQHLHQCYELGIDILNKKRIRWSAFDLDRYILPAYTQINHCNNGYANNKAEFISAMVKKNLRQ